MVLDRLGEYLSLYAACESIAPNLGVGPESLRRWTLQASRLDAKELDPRHCRLHTSIGGIPPTEFEVNYYRANLTPNRRCHTHEAGTKNLTVHSILKACW